MPEFVGQTHAVDVMRQKGPLMGLAQKLVAITYPRLSPPDGPKLGG
jgi:hypothetical protein